MNLNQPQLSSPLAYPTSLPLLAASVAGTEIITTDPVRHLEVGFLKLIFQLKTICHVISLLYLQSQIRDLLRAITGLSCVPVPGKVSFGQVGFLSFQV